MEPTSGSGAGNETTETFEVHIEVSQLMNGLREIGVSNVTLSPPPTGFEKYYRSVLAPEAVKFVALLCQTFQEDVESMLNQRIKIKQDLDRTGSLPDFPANSACRKGNWKVAPVPRRLKCRHVDLGDVSPSNTKHFIAALNSSANGIQVDFDDGHCPTWSNQLLGLYNVICATTNSLEGAPDISQGPVLMLRPRAWNMVEYNMTVNDKEVPGPLFDFGMLMYHCGKALLDCESGPFLYLSKIEGSNEVSLWNRIFCWTEEKLGLPENCTKVCVLIENVLAAFQMEEILFDVKDRSIGLNCGLWDYSASFINKFGQRKEFVLPDRNKYVSMDRPFLKSYRDLLIKTCHKRGAHATGGMAAFLLPSDQQGTRYREILEKVRSGKEKEIDAGADGILVYDIGLVEPMQQLFQARTSGVNQLHVTRDEVTVDSADLLQMPRGSVTLTGLKHNIKVGILFVEAWLRGQGHFLLDGAVEDSATAEISRSQVWQWLHHQTSLEEDGGIVTMEMIRTLAADVVTEISAADGQLQQGVGNESLHIAVEIFLDIVTRKSFIEFITTYLAGVMATMSR